VKFIGLAIMILAVSQVFGNTVVSRVTADLETRSISPDQAVFVLYNSVYDISLVPAHYTRETVPEPCGTPAMDLIFSLYDQCSIEVQGELDLLLSRPFPGNPYYTTITPSDFFKIHWTDAGANATNQAYVDVLAAAFDTSLDVLCNQLGFWEPPSDMGLGGCERYDIYIMSLSGGVMGYCSTNGEFPNPMTPNNDWSSHIAMSNAVNMYGESQMIETAAHEFAHAIQNAYDASSGSWFKENTSTWSQNAVFDTNHYADYMKSGENCLRRPWYDIRSGAMYHYGATPWPMYMQYRTGGSVDALLLVWENCAATWGNNVLDAIDEAATEYGADFITWLAEYTWWRWFTGLRADDNHYPYEEASLWNPGAFFFSYHNITSLPASVDQGVYAPKTYGHHWIPINVEAYQGWINLSFNGRNGFQWLIGVIRTRNDGTDDFYWTIVDNPESTLEWGVETTGWDMVIVFPQPIQFTTLTLNYEMDITHTTGIEGVEPAPEFLLEAGSNPFRGSGVLNVALPQAGYTTINVYNAAGRMVQNITAGELPAGQSVVNWDATNLESGTYFVRLTGAGGGVTSRVTVLN